MKPRGARTDHAPGRAHAGRAGGPRHGEWAGREGAPHRRRECDDDDPARFAAYTWGGNQEGQVTRLPYTFAKKAKPEGLTPGTVGGKPTIGFVDDGGGFRVVWL